MALGKRKHEQQSAWIATTELPKSPGHPFYKKLNQLLAEAGFDTWLETLCAPYYAAKMGRESIPPGVYFRMILVGYFEGISSQRGIAWRCHDSRSLAEFLGVPVHEETPDHSSLSRIHGRLPLEVHEAMFQFVLKLAAEKSLLRGKTVAVDSTLLEADAAMKSIVRRDTGEDWKTYLRGLAAEAGMENPTDEELRRFDKKRKGKKVSNDDWQSPNDPESRITKHERRHDASGVQGRARGRFGHRPGAVGRDLRGHAGRHRDAGRESGAGAVERDRGRQRSEYRRGGGRQGLSRGGPTGDGQRDARHSDLHSRAEAQSTLEVERSHRNRAAGDHRKSSARA